MPEALRGQFGEPERVMLLNLDGKRKLARADADRVLEQIRERGYRELPPHLPGIPRLSPTHHGSLLQRSAGYQR